MTAEVEFYRRPHGGGLTPSQIKPGPNVDIAFGPGGRYAIVAERLRAQPPSGDSIVELGCGGGEMLKHLAQRYTFSRMVGIDVAIKEPETVEGIEFRNDNLNAPWPFEDGSIDHLVAMMVYEPLFDPFHCFDETRRILSPRGRAYINVPLVTNVKNRLRGLFGYVPETSVNYDRWFKDRVWDGNHLHYFSVGSLQRLAKACGLEITDLRGVGRGHALKSALPSLLAGEVTFEVREA